MRCARPQPGQFLFAETEQIAFCPANVVPGIDLSNAPLLQGRLFSYLDRQLIRLGGPNFNQIPIKPAEMPVAQFAARRAYAEAGRQRSGRVRAEHADARGTARRPRARLRRHEPARERRHLAIRLESFADHYTQARLFYMSQTEPERNHMASALVFELSKGGAAVGGGATPRLAAQTYGDADRVDRIARTCARLGRAVRLDRADAKLHLALLRRAATTRRNAAEPSRGAARGSPWVKLLPPSILTSAAAMPRKDHAQPHISIGSPARITISGAGATMTALGAIAQTGRCAARPAAMSSAAAGSL
jgi:hypothetical protein